MCKRGLEREVPLTYTVEASFYAQRTRVLQTADCRTFSACSSDALSLRPAAARAQRRGPNPTPEMPSANQQHEFTRTRVQLLGPFMALAMAMVFQTGLGKGALKAFLPRS